MKITSEKLYVLFARGVEALGSLLFLKLLTSLVEQNEVGRYMLASSCVAAMLTISFSSLDQGILRNISLYDEKGQLPTCYSSVVSFYLAGSIVFSSFFLLLLSFFEFLSPLQGVLSLLVLWFSFDAVKNLNMTISSGLRRRSTIAGASVIDYGLRVCLILVSYNFIELSTKNVISILAASSFIVCLYYLWTFRSNISSFLVSEQAGILSDALKFSWPFFVWGGFSWLHNMVNRWLLSLFSDLNSVAEYSVLVSISTFPVAALLGVISTYAVPVIYQSENNKAGSSNDLVKKIVLYLIPLYATLIFVTFLWNQKIIVALSGADYANNSSYLPILVTGLAMSSVSSVLTYAIYAQRKVKSLLLANTLPGLFSLIFGYYMVQQYQLQGSVMTFFLSHLLASFLYIIAFLRLKGTASEQGDNF